MAWERFLMPGANSVLMHVHGQLLHFHTLHCCCPILILIGCTPPMPRMHCRCRRAALLPLSTPLGKTKGCGSHYFSSRTFSYTPPCRAETCRCQGQTPFKLLKWMPTFTCLCLLIFELDVYLVLQFRWIPGATVQPSPHLYTIFRHAIQKLHNQLLCSPDSFPETT